MIHTAIPRTSHGFSSSPFGMRTVQYTKKKSIAPMKTRLVKATKQNTKLSNVSTVSNLL